MVLSKIAKIESAGSQLGHIAHKRLFPWKPRFVLWGTQWIDPTLYVLMDMCAETPSSVRYDSHILLPPDGLVPHRAGDEVAGLETCCFAVAYSPRFRPGDSLADSILAICCNISVSKLYSFTGTMWTTYV